MKLGALELYVFSLRYFMHRRDFIQYLVNEAGLMRMRVCRFRAQLLMNYDRWLYMRSEISLLVY